MLYLLIVCVLCCVVCVCVCVCVCACVCGLPCSGIFGLGRKFKIMDDDGSKTINMSEFIKAMRETEVILDDASLRALFKVCYHTYYTHCLSCCACIVVYPSFGPIGQRFTFL